MHVWNNNWKPQENEGWVMSEQWLWQCLLFMLRCCYGNILTPPAAFGFFFCLGLVSCSVLFCFGVFFCFLMDLFLALVSWTNYSSFPFKKKKSSTTVRLPTSLFLCLLSPFIPSVFTSPQFWCLLLSGLSSKHINWQLQKKETFEMQN